VAGRAYKPFTSSARRDGVQLHHWVPANAEFIDYPFARFNKKARRDAVQRDAAMLACTRRLRARVA
jgi:hypothetical protein